MPRKPKDETENTRVLSSRIPNFEDGDTTGLDNLVLLAKVSSKVQKDGNLTRDCEFTMSVGDIVAEWPGRLAPFLPAVRAAVDGGPVLNAVYHPNVEVAVDVTTVDGDQQSTFVLAKPGVLRRVKVTAKKGEAELRWTLRLGKTDGMAQEFEDAQLSGPCRVTVAPAQQSLVKPKPKAEVLPPEAGDGPAH